MAESAISAPTTHPTAPIKPLQKLLPALRKAGVSTDQRVRHSVADANFLGSGCVMIGDCCTTTSPNFCRKAAAWSVKKCFGFVTDSEKMPKPLKK